MSEEVERAFDRVVSEVIERYPEVAAPEVRRVVGRLWSRFDAAPIQEFVPIFVARRARRWFASSRRLAVLGHTAPVIPLARQWAAGD